ncbi:MAG: hypothetical protein ABI859_18770 [Pseudomonadota bacterium]
MLRELQHLLEDIYDLPAAQDVSDFLLTDRASLPADLRSNTADEQLLVCEQQGEAAIGLFLDAAVLRRLQNANPLESLHGGNVADFWTVLEGVSHFLYLAWHVDHDRAVSLLELERQAEIDKYVTSLWLLRAQHPGRFPRGLHRLLFEQARVDPLLAGDREWLYLRANRQAARFCKRVERRLESAGAAARATVVAELRRFYRWSSAHKHRHIEQLA